MCVFNLDSNWKSVLKIIWRNMYDNCLLSNAAAILAHKIVVKVILEFNSFFQYI